MLIVVESTLVSLMKMFNQYYCIGERLKLDGEMENMGV